MALENLVGPNIFISNLVRTNPAIDDPVSQGDDHLRGIKNATLNSFPNITGAVTLTQAEINGIPATYAPLFSPAFTGVPTVPTAAAVTDNTQIANTAFANFAVTTRAIGISQSWQNLAGSRVLGASYTNATSKPIQVAVAADLASAGAVLNLVVGGVVVPGSSAGNTNYRASVSAIVPAGATYSAAQSAGGASGLVWAELR